MISRSIDRLTPLASLPNQQVFAEEEEEEASAGGGKGKKKKKTKKKKVKSPVDLYDRLARPRDEAWEPWGSAAARSEDAALGRLLRRAVKQWTFDKLASLRTADSTRGRVTLLMAAAAAGRVSAVRALLDEEAKAAAAAAASASASSSAAAAESMALARDAQGRTAAHYAVAAGEAAEAAVVAILERLLEAAGDERRHLLACRTRARQNLLHAAATRGGPVDEDEEEEEDGATAAGNDDEEGDNEEEEGSGAVVRFLVEALGMEQAAALAAQEDADGRVPLAVACAEGGRAECMAMLDLTPRAVLTAAEAEGDGERAHVTVLMKALARGGFGKAARYVDWIGLTGSLAGCWLAVWSR